MPQISMTRLYAALLALSVVGAATAQDDAPQGLEILPSQVRHAGEFYIH